MLAFATREDLEHDKTAYRDGLRLLSRADGLAESGLRIRQMDDVDLGRVLELRTAEGKAARAGLETDEIGPAASRE